MTPNMPPSPNENPDSIYTVGGRAKFDNYQTATRQADYARNAPAPGSNLSVGQRLARQFFPDMKTTAPGSMSFTDASGQTITRQGRTRPSDGIDAAQRARDAYIKDHDQLATALKPAWLTNKEQGIDQNRQQGQTQDLQNQMLHEQVDRYHQSTPAIIDRLTNSTDWTPEDRRQLLDTLRTYHDFNSALLRQADESRKQSEGERRGDQTDTRIGQGQQRIDQTGQFRDRSLDQRDRGLDQSGQRIENQKNRPAPRSGFGALRDLLTGGNGATTRPTTQPIPQTPPAIPYPGYTPTGGSQPRQRVLNATNTYPGMPSGDIGHQVHLNEVTRGDIKAQQHEPSPAAGAFTAVNPQTGQRVRWNGRDWQ
jgi:hypothetical protein